MILSIENEIINPKIPGKIIIGFDNIRLVSISKIRNHSTEIDQSLLFYLEILGTEIHSGGFSITKYQKAKLISSAYVIFFIRYSFNEMEEILPELNDKFSYFSIFESFDLFSDYLHLNYKMVNYKNYYFKNKSGNFISKKSIPGILSSFRKIYEFKESSLLEEFLKKS